MLRLRVAAVAAFVLCASAPAAAQEPAPAPPVGTYACWQTFASYGPTGILSGFNRATRGTVTFGDDGTYAAEGWVPVRRVEGAWRMDAGKVRFTSGPFWRPDRGWRLVGDLHPGGVRMPHDRRKGTRYELVLRSRPGARPHDDAPPRAEGTNFIITVWYCDAAR